MNIPATKSSFGWLGAAIVTAETYIPVCSVARFELLVLLLSDLPGHRGQLVVILPLPVFELHLHIIEILLRPVPPHPPRDRAVNPVSYHPLPVLVELDFADLLLSLEHHLLISQLDLPALLEYILLLRCCD